MVPYRRSEIRSSWLRDLKKKPPNLAKGGLVTGKSNDNPGGGLPQASYGTNNDIRITNTVTRTERSPYFIMGRLRRRELIPEDTPITGTLKDPKIVYGQFGRQVQCGVLVTKGRTGDR